MDDHNAAFQVPLAIVGMACRLPGADNLDQYWQLLIEGRSAVVELPPDRLDQDMYYDPEVGVRGKTYSKLGATRHAAASSTTPAARSTRRWSQSIDNVHLLMCDTAAEALRDAGMDPFNVKNRNTGVYIGHAQGSSLAGDYTYFSCMRGPPSFCTKCPTFHTLSTADQQSVIDELVGPGLQRCNAAHGRRARRVFEPRGRGDQQSLRLDRALPGNQLGMRLVVAGHAIRRAGFAVGHVDMAIVGGASDCKGDTLVLFSHARAMSSTGTRPFDSEADGIVCGEGYVALVMKTLDRALDDGDRIWSVIRGLGVSSDGRGKSLWAPRKEGQIKAMQRAYRGGLDNGRHRIP